MKITVFLFFVCSLGLYAASSYSQEKKLNLNVENTTIKQLLEKIKEQSDFSFWYNNDELNDMQKVTLIAQNQTIDKILDIALKNQDVAYEIRDRYILIYKPSYPSKTVQSTDTQPIKVSGKVIDGSNEEPLPGVNVTIKGTSSGAVTDLDGNFTIELPETEATLVFSYVGYLTEEVPYNGQSFIEINMVPNIQQLNEVVVVGYGTLKKSDVTGSMVSVSQQEIQSRPVANALEALQGKAAGVDITSNERPGELGKVTIRGMRSMIQDNNKVYTGNNPLYVVDGVPLMSTSGIETLNPRDIQSVDILKDASATAIYGSRGANGVVLITTNRGEKGKFSLNYSGSVTFENIVNKSPMMSASDYITWRRWAYYNANDTAAPFQYPRGDQPTLDADNDIFKAEADPYAWANIMKGWASGTWNGSLVQSTDWTDFVTQTGITQQHTISASGGSEKMQAYGSFGYLNQQGTQRGQAYDRYTTNINIDINPLNWFTMGGSVNAAWSTQEYGMSTLGNSSRSNPDNIYGAAQRIFSYAVPYDSNGDRILTPGGDGNVYTIIDEWNLSNQQRQMFRIIGSFYGQLDFENILEPLKGLKYRINFGPDYRNWREGVYIDGESVNRLGGNSYARLKNQRDFSWTLDNMLTYENTFGKHAMNVTLLQTASSWNIETSQMEGQNIPRADFLWNNFYSLDVASLDASVKIGSGLTERQLESYLGRLNYSFNDRYLLTISGRWDGASQLAAGHQWTFFPSAALGWRISQEQFMKDIDWINQLKLRLGVGSVGNAAVSPYNSLGAIQGFFVPFGGADNTQAYSPYEPNYTSHIYPMANQNLGWEITTQYNVGIDFSMLRNRISGIVDIYTSHTKDLLMSMLIPSVTGYKTTNANIGKTKNNGVDITLNTRNIAMTNFQWKSSINAAWQKDEIVSLAYGENDMVDNTWFIGQSIAVVYGIEGDGLWQESDAAEMQMFKDNGADFKAGMAKPVDQNGDYIINEEDRVIIGNAIPHWTLGFSNTFSYKGIELSFMIYGRLGYTVSTGGESQLGRYNQREINYWTPDNPNADYQMPIYNESGGDPYYSILGYKSGSFLKMRDISLGYVFPASLIKRLGVQNLKVYAQVRNPGTIYSAIDWLDMDLYQLTNPNSTGDHGGSTFNRGFVFGVNAGF